MPRVGQWIRLPNGDVAHVLHSVPACRFCKAPAEQAQRPRSRGPAAEEDRQFEAFQEHQQVKQLSAAVGGDLK
jgi:hypothetical protein